MNDKPKFATEIVTDESGGLLWLGAYRLKRKYAVGETFITDYKEYQVIASALTVGQHGGALVEHVVRLVADRTPVNLPKD